MSRTIRTLYASASQTFEITVDNLLPNTELEFFWNGLNYPRELVEQVYLTERYTDNRYNNIFNTANYSDKLITDNNGSITLRVLVEFNESPNSINDETSLSAYADSMYTGTKYAVVFDTASLNAIGSEVNLATNISNINRILARTKCYAFAGVTVSYGTSLTERVIQSTSSSPSLVASIPNTTTLDVLTASWISKSTGSESSIEEIPHLQELVEAMVEHNAAANPDASSRYGPENVDNGLLLDPGSAESSYVDAPSSVPGEYGAYLLNLPIETGIVVREQDIDIHPGTLDDLVAIYNDMGCPDPSTPILITSSTFKAAGDIQVGDTIYTAHEKTMVWGYFKVIAKEITSQPKLQFTFSDSTALIVSESHRFSVGSGWVTANDIKHGDVINGYPASKKVASISQMGIGDVVKFEIDDAHTYVAGGTLSHNVKVSSSFPTYGADGLGGGTWEWDFRLPVEAE